MGCGSSTNNLDSDRGGAEDKKSVTQQEIKIDDKRVEIKEKKSEDKKVKDKKVVEKKAVSKKTVVKVKSKEIRSVKVKSKGQVISVGIGEIGSQLTEQFFIQLIKERNELPDYYSKESTNVYWDNVYFHESLNDAKARALIVDIGSTFIDKSTLPKLLSEDNIFNAKGSSEGRYSIGVKNIFDRTKFINAFRKEAEKCDSVVAVQMFHSLGGGVGSGIAKSVQESMMKVSYPFTINHVLIPSVKDAKPQSIFNTVFGLNSLADYSSITNIFTQDGISNVCKQYSNDSDSIKLLGKVLSDFTSFTRYSGNPSGFLNMYQSLVPIPRLRIITLNFQQKFVEDNLKVFFSRESNLANLDLKTSGKFLSTSLILRGDYRTSIFERNLVKTFDESKYEFSNLLPTKIFQTSYVPYQRSEGKSALAVSNHSGILTLLKKYSDKFYELIGNKSNYEYYIKDGMEEVEVTVHGLNNVKNLILDYEYIQNDQPKE